MPVSIVEDVYHIEGTEYKISIPIIVLDDRISREDLQAEHGAFRLFGSTSDPALGEHGEPYERGTARLRSPWQRVRNYSAADHFRADAEW